RRGIPMQRVQTAEWIQVFDLFSGGRIPREAIPLIASRMATDGLNAEAAANAEGVTVLGRERWQREADSLTMNGYLSEKGDSPSKRLRFLAGRAMQKLKYKAPAKEVVAYLREAVEEVAR